VSIFALLDLQHSSLFLIFIIFFTYIFKIQKISVVLLTRVNSTNVLDEGLRIGEIGRQMNSKVKSVKQGVYQK
jgi:hypothetical protein